MPIIGVIASSGDRNVPNAPTIGTATNVPSGRAFNNGRADVTFTAPTYTGGLPITGYTVTSSPGGFTGTGASSPISVTGLQSNTAYTFTVTATNAIGTSAASEASNSITATTVPQAPTIGTATDLGTGTSVSVAFTANATGGSAITGFTATSSPGSITGTGGSSPITVGGLTAGTAYTFTVTATNANGTSLPSAASNSVTPAIPTSFDAIATIVGAGNSPVQFSNIPQTYRHLQIRCSAWVSPAISTNTIFIRFNNDVGNSYRYHMFVGDGTGVYSDQTTGLWNAVFGAGSVAGSGYAPAPSIIDIIDYSSTSKNKSVRSYHGVDGNLSSASFTINMVMGAYFSLNAITSIEIWDNSGSGFASGSSFALYGIRG